MNKETIFSFIKILVLLTLIITLISAFFYARKGMITRKGLIFTYTSFLLFTLSAWGAGVIYKPTLAFSSGICLFGFIVIFSIFWAIKYYNLSFFEKRLRGNKNEE